MSTEEKTYTVELTLHELSMVYEGLGRVIRNKYGNLATFNPYITREYAAKVVAEADEAWNLLERLRKEAGPICHDVGGTVEGEPAPLPDESEGRFIDSNSHE